MSTLNQFIGIAQTICPSSATITVRGTNVDSTTFCSTAPLGSRPNRAGGFMICKASSTAWIVSPRCAELTRTWYCRNDANLVAETCSGCTGWFVPTCGQLQNPGYTCRTFWDSFSSTTYWSSTEANATYAWRVFFTNGSASYNGGKTTTFCVRAFRCVTY